MTTNPKDVLVEALKAQAVERMRIVHKQLPFSRDIYISENVLLANDVEATINTLLGPEGEYVIVPRRPEKRKVMLGCIKYGQVNKTRTKINFVAMEEAYKAMIEEAEDAGTD